MKSNFALNITIFGEKDVGKSKLIEDYISQKTISKTKRNKDFISFSKTVDNVSMKLNLYEFSDIPERKKEIGNHHCVIIMFDMTSRQAFEDVLDKWIKFLRQLNYVNTIILLGTNNYKDNEALPMTDEKEISDLIDIASINGTFHYIGDKTTEQKNQLIDQLIESTYVQAKNNKNYNYIHILSYIFKIINEIINNII